MTSILMKEIDRWDRDLTTQGHFNILKKVAQVWEIAPQWQLCQVINYIRNFCPETELYNISDDELSKVCDKVTEERDRHYETLYYTKPLLIMKLLPKNRVQYLQAARDILSTEEYDKVVKGIMWANVYEEISCDLRFIVDTYYILSE